MKFKDRLLELGAQAGLTQEQMAKKAVVVLVKRRGLERGQHRPSWKSVVKLARALDVTTDVFADCEEPARGEGG
jgi:transcriptional regulator with XRE-family HTH domain